MSPNPCFHMDTGTSLRCACAFFDILSRMIHDVPQEDAIVDETPLNPESIDQLGHGAGGLRVAIHILHQFAQLSVGLGYPAGHVGRILRTFVCCVGDLMNGTHHVMDRRGQLLRCCTEIGGHVTEESGILAILFHGTQLFFIIGQHLVFQNGQHVRSAARKILHRRQHISRDP